MADMSIVEEYEQRFGQEAAIEQARRFMSLYISRLRHPLPIAAAETAAIVRKYIDGEANKDDLRIAAKVCARVLYSGHVTPNSKEEAALEAVKGATYIYYDRGYEAVDLVDAFLRHMHLFEDHSDEDDILLKQSFSEP